MDRREFLKCAAATTAALALGSDLRPAAPKPAPRRWLATECLEYPQECVLEGWSTPRIETGRSRTIGAVAQSLKCWTTRPFERLYELGMPGWWKRPGRPEHYGAFPRLVMNAATMEALSDAMRANTLLIGVPGALISLPHVVLMAVGLSALAAGVYVCDNVHFISSAPKLLPLGPTAVRWKEYDESASQIVYQGPSPSAEMDA